MATATTYVFNPADYNVPPELGFTIGTYILLTIYQRIFSIVRRDLGRDPTYDEMRDELMRIADRGTNHKYEIKLNNILGQKNPTPPKQGQPEGNAIQVLRMYFFEDAARRKAVWTQQLASAFIDNIPDGVRIGFKYNPKYVMIVITADNRKKGVESDLYHLTMPRTSSDPKYLSKKETIHFTEEGGNYHAFYRFDTLAFVEEFGTLQHRGADLLSSGGTGGAPQGQGGNTSSAASASSSSVPQAPAPAQGQGGNYVGPARSYADAEAYLLRQIAADPSTQRWKWALEGLRKRPETYVNVRISGGKRKRRSTRRRPRRALRKTRKAYI